MPNSQLNIQCVHIRNASVEISRLPNIFKKDIKLAKLIDEFRTEKSQNNLAEVSPHKIVLNTKNPIN